MCFVRVREKPAGGSTRTLVSTVLYDTCCIVDDVFSVDVMPGIDSFGEYCPGGDALLDLHPAIAFFDQGGSDLLCDGIQVQLSPDPALASTLLGVWKRRWGRSATVAGI